MPALRKPCQQRVRRNRHRKRRFRHASYWRQQPSSQVTDARSLQWIAVPWQRRRRQSPQKTALPGYPLRRCRCHVIPVTTVLDCLCKVEACRLRQGHRHSQTRSRRKNTNAPSTSEPRRRKGLSKIMQSVNELKMSSNRQNREKNGKKSAATWC